MLKIIGPPAFDKYVADFPAMEPCPYCRISGRLRSKIRAEIQANCVKNRNGTCVACSKLATVDRKIEEAQRLLNNLLDEREALVCTLNEHHDPMANQLPIEITTNIFLHCQPPRPNPCYAWNKYGDSSLRSSVLTPGHICKNWRSISQQSPQLWSILCLTATKSNCIQTIEVALYWIQRSAEVPLYVQLNVPDPDVTTRPFVLKLFSIIATTAHRWETLHLAISRTLLNGFSEMLSNQRLHLLNALKLHRCGTLANGVLLLDASPRFIVAEGEGTMPVQVGLENLIHFEKGYGSSDTSPIDEHLLLFRSAPSLTYCSISSSVGRKSINSPVEGTSLQTLHAIEIHDDFWNHFTFPQLETLHLSFHTAWQSLQSLIIRSQCSVKTLLLNIHEDDPHLIADIFNHIPDLEDLSLCFYGTTNIEFGLFFSLLDAIASRTSNGFSKLASISLSVYKPGFDWCSLTIFLATMVFRREASLRSFEFNYEYEEDVGWNDSNLPLPVDTYTIERVAHVTRNLDSASIYDTHGNDVLKNYR